MTNYKLKVERTRDAISNYYEVSTKLENESTAVLRIGFMLDKLSVIDVSIKAKRKRTQQSLKDSLRYNYEYSKLTGAERANYVLELYIQNGISLELLNQALEEVWKLLKPQPITMMITEGSI